ncbi:endocuticle structural glycoprotein SgAbd-5-like [Amyelois transitella]|uniref:endocuticle structural glycoprotein SgAbd-5-like n=1 Tax=Amyelois transitella TaxID=680683 RepID=UPI00067E3495|nr:endocuticle structural glycoprotein SgAbd-5-like [Amyelois transitella]
MNKLVLLCLISSLASSTLAASILENAVKLLKHENNNDGSGNYRFFFEQSDETRHEQIGTLRNAGTDNAFVASEGFYTWRAPSGLLYLVKYIADENGFQPTVEEGPGALPPAATASLLG